MEYEEIEIFFSPTKIFWCGMSDENVINQIKVELLKRDILLINCSQDELENIADNISETKSTVLFNLDNVLSMENQTKGLVLDGLLKLIQLVKDHSLENCIFHTTVVNKNISDLIKKNNYLYMEKDLSNAKTSISILKNIVQLFQKDENKETRSYMRIQFYPRQKIKVSLYNVKKPKQIFTVFLKDISLNGFGLVFTEKKDFDCFQVKDMAYAKLFIGRSIIKIEKALVRRVEKKILEIGFYFDLDNPNMIEKEDASVLTALVQKSIDTIFANKGKDFDLNFQHIKI